LAASQSGCGDTFFERKLDESTTITTHTAKPWGYVATLLWALLVFVLAQVAGIAALYWWFNGDLRAVAAEPYRGDLIALVTLVTNPIEIVLLAIVAWFARWNPAEYLGLVLPRSKDLAPALMGLVALIVGGDVAMWLFGQEFVPPFQIIAYQTARATGWLPGLAIATIVAAPAGEEVFFRGFLFRGWVRSPRGAAIAIPIISVIFASLHVQYNIYGMLQILIVGLFLGWLRWRSGSTVLTMLCHAALNLESSLETFVKVQGFL
jgi:membrane protease YdiL (CAAX protease family)